jgi:citrate lyase subunit beta/citryl-CoA lyase
MLFVPANREKFILSAHRRGADVIALDLEDSVPASEKAAARASLRDAVPMVGREGAEVFIRANKSSELLIDDLDAAIAAKPAGLIFPKVDSADEVRTFDAMTAEREVRRGAPRGTLEFILLIESAIGLERIFEIAAACSRTTVLSLGLEDLSRELEIDLTEPGYDLSWAHGRLVLAARAHGLAPFGLLHSIAKIGDAAELARIVAASRQFGYTGSLCIHPSQVPVLNSGFSPSAEQIAKAKEIVEAYERAEQEGRGAIAVDGRMVDVPVAERARRVLRRADRQKGKPS